MLREFLAHPDYVVAGPHVIGLRSLVAFRFKQLVYAVERNAPVVADDAAAAIGIGKASDDAGLPALHDLERISVEHPFIMGLAVFCERFMDPRIGLETRRFQASLDHAQAAEREDRAFERLIGLKADNHLVLAVDVSGFVREQRRGRFRINSEHAFLAFFLEIGLEFLPDRQCPFGGAYEKGFIACVRGNIADDEIAHCDGMTPIASPESSPRMIIVKIIREESSSVHGAAPYVKFFSCQRMRKLKSLLSKWPMF